MPTVNSCASRARRWSTSQPSPASLAFIRPIVPSSAASLPTGEDLLHEPKWDGFRFQIVKNGSDVRLHCKSGANNTAASSSACAKRSPNCRQPRQFSIVSFASSARGVARCRWPEEEAAHILAFDLLHQDGVDLDRSANATSTGCAASRTRLSSKYVETFPDGEVLFDCCNKFGFEGGASKRWIRCAYWACPSKQQRALRLCQATCVEKSWRATAGYRGRHAADSNARCLG